MTNKDKNLNKDFYTEHMLDSTVLRKGVWPEEAKILKKYLVDTSKKVIEAGAGGGRLTFFIEEIGFNDVTGYDIVPEMVDFANKESKEKNSSVKFVTGDASKLDLFADESFDYLVYIQQVLCFVPKKLFTKSLEETYRISKKGGTIIFSFLDYESRFYNPFLGGIANFLRYVRKEEVSKYHLPWLKLNDTQFNWKLFSKGQPSVYWTTQKAILTQLNEVGFETLEVIHGHKIHPKGNKGALYVVCKK